MRKIAKIKSFHNKHILITGASFIGQHLIDKLITRGAGSIRVVNLTPANKYKLKKYLGDVEFIERDLRDLSNACKSVKGVDIVFHLAADHGGRGYVDLNQGSTASNLLLDGSVFYAALQEGVEKIFFASSGCVYPNYLQKDVDKEIFLKETDVTSPYDADNMYGWAKLMGEMTLKAYYKDFGLKSAIGRFFTVYGESASESHAVMGSIAKAFVEQDPYLVWGNGSQVRNWTYVSDIVEGILAATTNIDNATPINLGTQERISVSEMVELIFQNTGYRPKRIKYVNMPQGPVNRVASNTLAKNLLGWTPKYTFEEGLKKTIDWYFETKDKEKIRKHLDSLLLGKKRKEQT